MTIMDQFSVLWQFLKRDWFVLRQSLVDRVINGVVWAIITIFVNTYLTPRVGMDNVYGVFIFAGGIVSQMLFQSMADVAQLVSDLRGDQTVTYYLSLPMPSWMVLLRYAISTGLKGLFLSMVSFPVAYVILGSQFSLLTIHWVQFILMLVMQSLFWGYFSLILASFTIDITEYENVWMRIAFPMWFLGCYTYTWASLSVKFNLLSYIVLANPMTYAMEGMRAAVLANVVPSMNFWHCFFALGACTMLFSWLSYRAMKRRLDFV